MAGSVVGLQLGGLSRASLRSVRNSWWRSGPGRRVAAVVSAPAVLLLWAALVPASQHLLRAAHLGTGVRLLGLLATVCVVLGCLTIASSVSFALAAIYFSRDGEWLLVSPISTRLFLTHRLISQLAVGAGVGLALGGPVVLGAALYYRSPLLVPATALMLLLLLVTPMAVAVWLVVVLVRLVPARRVKDAAAILVGVVGFGVAAVDVVAAVGSGHSSGVDVAHFATGLQVPDWLPPAWAAHGLAATAAGHLGPALGDTALLLGLAIVAVPLALVTAAPLVRDGWFRSQYASPRRRRSGRWVRLPATVAVLRKDWRLLRRDPAQLIQLLLPIGLFAVYLLSPGGTGTQGLFRDFPAWYGPLTTSAFAALFAASGLGLRAVGAEGGRFWCLRGSPLSASALLLSKAALPALISVGSSLTLLLSAELREGLSPAAMMLSASMLCLLVCGLSGLATGMGAIWPRLDWTDPRRAVGIGLAVAFMVVGSTYIVICVVALTVPLLITGLPPWSTQLLAVLTCAFCAGCAATVSLRVGTHRLMRLEV